MFSNHNYIIYEKNINSNLDLYYWNTYEFILNNSTM